MRLCCGISANDYRADRVYQTADARFYAGDFEEAMQLFWEIAADASSPWSGLVPYVVARCLIRQGTMSEAAPAATAAGDDLSDWVHTFKAPGREALEHSRQRWKTTSSRPWLVAAITKVPAQDPRAEELLAAAAAVKPGSPAFASVAFHAVRLLAGSGRQGEARARLDALLSPASTGGVPSERWTDRLALNGTTMSSAAPSAQPCSRSIQRPGSKRHSKDTTLSCPELLGCGGFR